MYPDTGTWLLPSNKNPDYCLIKGLVMSVSAGYTVFVHVFGLFYNYSTLQLFFFP